MSDPSIPAPSIPVRPVSNSAQAHAQIITEDVSGAQGARHGLANNSECDAVRQLSPQNAALLKQQFEQAVAQNGSH